MRRLILPMLLAFVAFFNSTYVSRTVFERLPHLEDEIAYLYQARVFARGDVTAPSPDPARPFWQPFVVDYEGRRFSKYAPGWSLVLAGGVWAGAPWVVNALCAALAVALTYRLGHEMFSGAVGGVAAWLVAFSPMALLLNGTLMSHSLALVLALAFMWGYWRVSHGGGVGWGLLAGAALGLLAATRSLTALALAAPFVFDSVIRLAAALRRRCFCHTLRPLAVLGVAALIGASLVPWYRYATVGDPTLNPYLLVWEYDRVGFGPDVGRRGHTLEKGLRQARYDLSLTASDLFGWQFTPLTAEQRIHLLQEAGTYPGRGFSFVLLPLGVIVGLWRAQTRRATLLVVAVVGSMVLAHTAYWIGSQRYSTRYYYEALPAAALLTALPVVALARWQVGRLLAYGGLAAVTLTTLLMYTLPRVQLLEGFNRVERSLIEQVQARRMTDAPALVVITGNTMTWRAGGALLALTGPYLDDDIVMARNLADGRYLRGIYMRFPEREVISMQGDGSNVWFSGEQRE